MFLDLAQLENGKLAAKISNVPGVGSVLVKLCVCLSLPLSDCTERWNEGLSEINTGSCLEAHCSGQGPSQGATRGFFNPLLAEEAANSETGSFQRTLLSSPQVHLPRFQWWIAILRTCFCRRMGHRVKSCSVSRRSGLPSAACKQWAFCTVSLMIGLWKDVKFSTETGPRLRGTIHPWKRWPFPFKYYTDFLYLSRDYIPFLKEAGVLHMINLPDF